MKYQINTLSDEIVNVDLRKMEYARPKGPVGCRFPLAVNVLSSNSIAVGRMFQRGCRVRRYVA